MTVLSTSQFKVDIYVQHCVRKQRAFTSLLFEQFLLLFKQFIFNWNIAALQCCINFCCAVKLVKNMFTYIPSFLDVLPIWVTMELWVVFPVLYRKFYYLFYTYYCIHVNPNFLIHSTHLLPLSVYMFVLCVCVSIFSLQAVSLEKIIIIML